MRMSTPPSLQTGDALLVVDVQNDFLPGGALAVPEGDAVIPVLNRWIRAARAAGIPVAFSRDWHPPDHVSFEPHGGQWPVHCVRETDGAAFHPGLCLPEGARIVSKAERADRDAYSAFDGTDLADWLRGRGVERIWIGGLTQDYCVRYSVLDARRAGFDIHVIADATRAVNLQPGDGYRALAEMADAGAVIHDSSDPSPASRDGQASECGTSGSQLALLTDLYELTMVQAYHRAAMHESATFELFFRELPSERNFAVAAGLDDVLGYLETLRFTDDDLDYLQQQPQFDAEFIDWLATFRFTGDVYAMPEGTVFFPHEPVLQVVAPLPEAQLVETMLINQVHLQTIAASKAARVVLAAQGRTVVDFGARRAHGIDAALKMARCCYLAGAAGTSNVLAGRRYGIPIFGTMAHSYVQAFGDELAAWEHFARMYPDTTLLVDTYDTLGGVRNVVRLRDRMGDGFNVRAVRLDSGDLATLARQSRAILDDAGLAPIKIIVSGNLDEVKIAQLLAAGAPIDGFGVGTRLTTSADAPTLDFAYKLVEYAGQPRTKLASGKAIHPCRKQVYRRQESDQFTADTITHHTETAPGRPLLQPVMQHGHRLPAGQVDLETARHHAATQLAALPSNLRTLEPADQAYPVEFSPKLEEVLDRLRREHG